MVFDAIVTGLMIFYMRKFFKNGSASTIMRVFIREGLLYFVVMCVAGFQATLISQHPRQRPQRGVL